MFWLQVTSVGETRKREHEKRRSCGHLTTTATTITFSVIFSMISDVRHDHNDVMFSKLQTTQSTNVVPVFSWKMELVLCVLLWKVQLMIYGCNHAR